MLNTQSDRIDYRELLSPPPRYKTSFAVGTTYSLDLETLTAVCAIVGLNVEADTELTQSPLHSTNISISNQLHVEKILGFGDPFKKELCVTGVTVIWCATSDLNETSVVGWYKNATVFRKYQSFKDDKSKERFYNILALSSNCVLLPQGTRHRHIWSVPSKKYTRAFGFGQSMLWYAQEEKAVPYLQRLTDNINSYNEENWLHKYPEK